MEFILFFQAYSNTNAPVDELRRVYDAGLALAPFRGLNVATRPDCMDDEKADLLASYRAKGLEVWVELGLQSANDATLRRIGRGHTAADFHRAYEMLRRRHVKMAVHLIFGLPGEGTRRDPADDARCSRGSDPTASRSTTFTCPRERSLPRSTAKGEFDGALPPRRHLEYVIAAIERLPPETVIMRLICDTPAERLAAPRAFWPKERFSRSARRRRCAARLAPGKRCTRTRADC